MESGETYEGRRQEFDVAETSKSTGGQLPPLYFNTTDNASLETASSSSFQQFEKSPGFCQEPSVPPAAQAYNDPYHYQQHMPSPGANKFMKPGVYHTSAGWPNPSQATQQSHNPYGSSSNNRYQIPSYSYGCYVPSKPYNSGPTNVPPSHSSMTQQAWAGKSYSPSQALHVADVAGLAQHIQADIAGPVVPAGLQSLQTNNNNAALMQHQHTPMLVPNPHYNQTRVQSQPVMGQHSLHQKNPIEPQNNENHEQVFLRRTQDSVVNVAGLSGPNNTMPSGYYNTLSPNQPQSNLGSIHHHQVAQTNSPSFSPYPTTSSTTESLKSKARGKKCYQCPKCVKVFRRGDHLKRHLLSVHDHEHPYQCGECGKGFASVSTVLKHAKSLHLGALTKGLMCLRCQMTFLNMQELETHATSLHVQEDELYMQNINTSSKQHMCNTCSKSFTSATNLKRHMQLQHRSKDETKLFCRECGKGFSRTDNLRKHIDRVHFGNPSAMPDLEEHGNEVNSISNPHSSESESRGVSADTDESSLSAPPLNAMQQYAQGQQATAEQPSFPIETSEPQSKPVQPPNTYPQYVKSTEAGSQHQSQVTQSPLQYPPLPVTRAPTMPSATIAVGHVPQQAAHIRGTGAKEPKKVVPMSIAAVDNMMVVNQAQNVSLSSHQVMSMPQVTRSTLPSRKIETKSVSEALSMAMKALTDFEYEVPGCETYSTQYPSNQGIPQAQVQHTQYAHQNYSYSSMIENGGVSISPHPPDGGSGTPYPSHLQYHLDGNFLMTMPPPPGSINMGCHPPQPTTAVVQEAPQLSRLLQEGGGGVNSPTVINNNNNCNTPSQGQERISVSSPGMWRKGRSRKTRDTQESNEENEEFGFGDDYGKNNDDMPKEDNSVEGNRFNCTICNTEYDGIDNLMTHVEGVHLKKNPHECCICHKKFAQAGNVKRHIRFVHLRERPFRCKDCASTFDRLCYLQRHMRSHLQPNDTSEDFDHLKPCNCPECGKRCLTAHHLRGHMQRKHFAKNKQNYGQFLMKYRHLEAIGAGPGALTNPNRGRKHGKKRKALKTDDILGPSGQVDFTIRNNTQDSKYCSSPVPYSSIQVNSLSNFQEQDGTPCNKIQNVPNPNGHSLHQPNYQYQAQMQLKMYPEQYNPVSMTGTTKSLFGTSRATSPKINIECQTSELMGNGSGSIGLSGLNAIARVVNGLTAFQVIQDQMNGNMGKSPKRNRTKKRSPSQKLLAFRCQHCIHRSFRSLSMLKSHLSFAHRTTLKRHVCLQCGDSYRSSTLLASHLRKTHRIRLLSTLKQSKKPMRAHALSESNQIAQNANSGYLSYSNTAMPPCYPIYNGSIPGQQDQIMPYLTPQHGPLYGYTTGPTTIVAASSGTIQTGYNNPQHHMSTHLPLVQT